MPRHVYPEGGGVAPAGRVDAAPAAVAAVESGLRTSAAAYAYQPIGGDPVAVARGGAAVGGRRRAYALLVGEVVG